MKRAGLFLWAAALSASAQLEPLTDFYQNFGRGLTVGTNVTVELPGTLRWNPSFGVLQVYGALGWTTVGTGGVLEGDQYPLVFEQYNLTGASRGMEFRQHNGAGEKWTNTLFFYSGQLYIDSVPGRPVLRDAPATSGPWARQSNAWVEVTGGSGGSGFPLESDANMAGFSLTNGFFVGDGSGLTNLPAGGASWSGFAATQNVDMATKNLTNATTVQATNGQFKALTVSGGSTSLGPLSAGATTLGNTTVAGNLTVTGTTYNITTVYITTNVSIGMTTSYVWETVYSTNVSYSVYIVYTNIISTNTVNTYVDIGGTWDASNSAWVAAPHFTDTKGGNLVAGGTWDFTAAALLGLPSQGITNIGAGLTGDGLTTPLAVAWGHATTNDLTNINWSAMSGPGGSGVTNIGVGLTGDGLATPLAVDGWADLTNKAAQGATAHGWGNWSTNNFMAEGDTNYLGTGLEWNAGKLEITGEGVLTNLPANAALTDASNNWTAAQTFPAGTVVPGYLTDSASEGAPKEYAATNAAGTNYIQLLAGTNSFNQIIPAAAWTNPVVITVPERTNTATDVGIWLRFTKGATALTWTTNHGRLASTEVPVSSTSGVTRLRIWCDTGSTNFNIRRQY